MAASSVASTLLLSLSSSSSPFLSSSSASFLPSSSSPRVIVGRQKAAAVSVLRALRVEAATLPVLSFSREKVGKVALDFKSAPPSTAPSSPTARTSAAARPPRSPAARSAKAAGSPTSRRRCGRRGSSSGRSSSARYADLVSAGEGATLSPRAAASACCVAELRQCRVCGGKERRRW
ncbi:hypothetical protein E2562_032642 [Oryza meyeriana var. granulata]|uniref:Uncharacterized protein n=1 Tax=Oryza meyeriana var. granulata TaxID=110450 RepID=A0A6G1CK60_9ORYZ|nr:hypothetical protein E2562_032642 [Oryza meyeriana var. granulata]